MTFGERLRQLRAASNLSQAKLSDQINQFFLTKLNKATISRLENNAQKPTVYLLETFAQFFNVSLDFMNGEEDAGADIDYDDVLALRQDLRQNPDMKILFSLSKKAPKSDVLEAIRLLNVLKKR